MNVAYNIDCMEYMKTLPDNAFELAVVDPPYGDGNGGKAKRFGGMFDAVYGLPTRERERAERGTTASGSDLTGTSKSVSRTGGTWAEKYGKKS